jgi:hypothetical protein
MIIDSNAVSRELARCRVVLNRDDLRFADDSFDNGFCILPLRVRPHANQKS